MPGYLDGNVPAVFALHAPDETQRHYANELELYRGSDAAGPAEETARYRRLHHGQRTSSVVGQGCSSDTDIWVCHRSLARRRRASVAAT